MIELYDDFESKNDDKKVIIENNLDVVWSQVLRQLHSFKVVDEKYLRKISLSIKYSYFFADETNKRFELGESSLAKSSVVSYHYAKDVLNDRFIEGEKQISKNYHISYLYAQDVIKSRFELGELAISKDTEYSYVYAKEILKCRFELGELAISKDSRYSCFYSMCVKERFRSGELLCCFEKEFDFKYYLKNNLKFDHN